MDWAARLARDDGGYALLTAIVLGVALAMAHAGTRALADSLRRVDGQRTAAGLDDLGLGDALALAHDVLARVLGLPRLGLGHLEPLVPVLGHDERCTVWIEVGVEPHDGRALGGEHADNVDGNGWARGDAGRVDRSRVDEARGVGDRADDPVARRVLGARTREGVDYGAGDPAKNVVLRLAQHLLVRLERAIGLQRHRVARRWAEDQVAPKRRLDKAALAVDGVRRGEEDVARLGPLVLV
eukprot:scaffold11493_cov31-Tisochrysis_lutea.AAC.3